MWICKKCKEENEDTFDACWSCQKFSKKSYKKTENNHPENEHIIGIQSELDDDEKDLIKKIYNPKEKTKNSKANLVISLFIAGIVLFVLNIATRPYVGALVSVLPVIAAILTYKLIRSMN